MKYILFFMTPILLIHCGSKKMTTISPNEKLLEYSTTPCFGFCPVYDLTIFQNGLMQLKAKQNMKEIGLLTKTLSSKETKALKRRIDQLEISALQDEYREAIADAPGKEIKFHYPSSKKIVTNFEYPLPLQKFTDSLHALVIDGKWEKFIDKREKTEFIIKLHDGKNLSKLLAKYQAEELMLGKRLDPATNQYWMVTAMLMPDQINVFISKLKAEADIKEVQLNKVLETR